MWDVFLFAISPLLVLFAAGLILYLYIKLTTGVCKCKTDMQNKVILVTGANTGIGLETARNLVSRNAKVIIACRDLRKGELAKLDIENTTGKINKVEIRHLDLSDLNSVRKFSQEFLETETRLDVLINNAAICFFPKLMTSDGLDTIMATNYFGPFLLTVLLLPLLKKSAPARIIMVSSVQYRFGHIDLANLRGERSIGWHRISTYSASKLAGVLFALELSAKLRDTGVTINSLHPGNCSTQIHGNYTNIFVKPFVYLANLYFVTLEEATQTIIHLAISKDVENITGKFFVDCKIKMLSARGENKVLAKQLWDETNRILGIAD